MRCVSGSVLDVGDQEPEVLAPVDLVGRRLPVLGEVDVHRVHADGLRAAQMVERAVAGDPVQPRPHVDLALSARMALKAAAKTSCSTSSASSFEDSMCRQNASRRAW